MSRPRALTSRLAIAALVALAGAAGIALVADDDRASGGGPTAVSAGRGWSALAPSPLARSEVGAARIGGFIYVVGGFIPPFDTTGQVARYEIATGSWDLVGPLPIGVNHPAVTAHRGRLYVHGGYRGANSLDDETDALFSFDPATGAWTELTASGFPRAAHTLASVGSRIYAIGGAHDGSVPLTLVQSYDPARDRWRAEPSIGVAREHLASAVIGRRIFVLGGRAEGRNLAVVERLDTSSGDWARLPPMRTARSGFGAASVKGRVVVAGGEQLAEGDQTIAAVELYLPELKRWRRLPRMITPRHGLGVAAVGRRLFTLEGGPQPGLAFSGTLEALLVPKSRLRG